MPIAMASTMCYLILRPGVIKFELAAAIAVGKYGLYIGFMNWDGCVVCALLVCVAR